MDNEILNAIRSVIKEELAPIKNHIDDLKNDISEIKNDVVELKASQKSIEELEVKNANRYIGMTDQFKQINTELDELKEVTKQNCYDISALRARK